MCSPRVSQEVWTAERPWILLSGIFHLALFFHHAAVDARPYAELENSISNYAGDAAFLNLWAGSFYNFPTKLWDTTSGQPCEFVGLKCSQRYGGQYVTLIDLSYSPPSQEGGAYIEKLRGNLDWNVSGLLFLESLSLANNALSGPIPPELALAPSLKSLNLENNQLSGRLSDTLCNLNLSCLHLAGNHLEGEIPSCWKKFPCADFVGNSLRMEPGETCQPGIVKSCQLDTTILYAPEEEDSTVHLGDVVRGAVVGLVSVLVLGGLVLFIVSRTQEARLKRMIKHLEAKMQAGAASENTGLKSSGWDDDKLDDAYQLSK